MKKLKRKQARSHNTQNKQVLVFGKCKLVGFNLINPGKKDAYVKLYDSNNIKSIKASDPSVTLLVPRAGTVFLSSEDEYKKPFVNGIVAAVSGKILNKRFVKQKGSCYIEIQYLQKRKHNGKIHT